MNSFEIYQLYLALKRHFTDESYNYFRYNGKVKANADSFNRRSDRFFFEKIAKHKNPQEFLLANILNDKNAYIRDIAYSEEAQKTYLAWLKTKESLTYLFNEEVKKLSENFNSHFVIKDGCLPNVIRLYLQKQLSLETLCILCELSKCLDYWDRHLKGDIIYDDLQFLIRRYIPFISYDKSKLKQIILSVNNQSKEA